MKKQLNELKDAEYEPVLFAGYIKSGNTWLRFLIYNYFNILLNNAEDTLSYSELNAIQHDSLGDPVPVLGAKKGFPNIVRTHRHNSEVFNQFRKCIYIYRNPLDTLVSAYHFERQRENPDFGNAQKKQWLSDIDNFVLDNLIYWELHVKSYLGRKNILVTKYEDLQEDPLKELERVISYLGYRFNSSIGGESVRLSSFQNIQTMGRQKNQIFGNGGSQFKGEFARRGIVGGFKEELKPSTIKAASYQIEKFFDIGILK